MMRTVARCLSHTEDDAAKSARRIAAFSKYYPLFVSKIKQEYTLMTCKPMNQFKKYEDLNNDQKIAALMYYDLQSQCMRTSDEIHILARFLLEQKSKGPVDSEQAVDDFDDILEFEDFVGDPDDPESENRHDSGACFTTMRIQRDINRFEDSRAQRCPDNACDYDRWSTPPGSGKTDAQLREDALHNLGDQYLEFVSILKSVYMKYKRRKVEDWIRLPDPTQAEALATFDIVSGKCRSPDDMCELARYLKEQERGFPLTVWEDRQKICPQDHNFARRMVLRDLKQYQAMQYSKK